MYEKRGLIERREYALHIHNQTVLIKINTNMILFPGEVIIYLAPKYIED